MQNKNRDLERLDAKGKATDLRALRISTVHEHWPRLAEAFEAKSAADAARKASKASKAAARLDQATAGMRQTLRAFLQQKPARAAAKPAAGALHVSFFAPNMNILRRLCGCLTSAAKAIRLHEAGSGSEADVPLERSPATRCRGWVCTSAEASQDLSALQT